MNQESNEPMRVLAVPCTDKISEALAKAQLKYKPINKSKKGVHGSMYAPLDEVIDACRPALNAEGIALTFSEMRDGKGMSAILTHKSGQCLTSECRYTGQPKTMQDMGGFRTYARRYAAEAVLGVASEDDDDGERASGLNQRKPAPKRKPPARESKPQKPSDGVYRIPFGKDCKGQTLEQLGAEQAIKLADWVANKMKDGDWKTEFLSEFEKFMATGEPAPTFHEGELSEEQFEQNINQLKNHAPGGAK